MVDIISYDEALKRTEGKRRTLLVANGFSIKYFSYKTLLAAAELNADDPVLALFKALDTVDFERVISGLESAAVVERAYKDEKRAAQFAADADRLREALVKAVKETHPGHREDIADVIPSCIAFLRGFETIFTLNYDLLLYWVILAEESPFGDGFGLGTEENGFRGPFVKGAYCHVYNLHGGLHLFLTPTGDVEKRLMGASGVIDAIAHTITHDKRLPIYVAEGTSTAKLGRINSVAYLRHCYERLGESSSNFFVYGHSADANDAHIYDALFNSDIEHLYFCIHKPTAKVERIDGELARYKRRNASEIDYTFVDSETVHIWDGAPKK
jgi:hypothetical protein